MVKKSVRTDRGERLSSVVAGDTRRYGGGRVTRSDFAGNLQQGYGGGGLGMPVTNLGANVKRSKDQSRVPTPRSIGGMKAYGTAPGGTPARKYSQPIGPSNRGTAPGGAGIPGLNNVRLRPTAGAPKATVVAGTPAMKTATAGAGRGFGKAFADARRAGKSTFSFGGKSYTTAVKGEMRKAAGGTTARKATGGVATRSAGGKPTSSFGKAFSSARAAGKSSFSFGGKSYSTAMKGETRSVKPTGANRGGGLGVTTGKTTGKTSSSRGGIGGPGKGGRP
jgi:hypothetical protein